jgi:hypothetical protein
VLKFTELESGIGQRIIRKWLVTIIFKNKEYDMIDFLSTPLFAGIVLIDT